MQYYRLWIYACNLVLGLASAAFIIFAAFVVADVRISLLEGVELYHPTLIYAYGALFCQCGVVQAIGCLGAQRLSHKLLSLYWTVLLLLTLGDIGVGLYWVFRLEKVKINLLPYLSKEFIEKYSTDETFTLRWDKIQSQDRCCGVDGPLDFEKFSSSQLHLSDKPNALKRNSHVIVDVDSGLLLSVPPSCCTLLYVPSSVSGSGSSGTSLDKTYSVPHYPFEEEHPPYNDQSGSTQLQSQSSSASYHNHNHHTNPGDSHLYPPDYAGDGGGNRYDANRRRGGRTVVNFPHKNDHPHYHPQGPGGLHLLHEKNEGAEFITGGDDDEIDTDFYYDSDYIDDESQDHEDKKGAALVEDDVPDDHNRGSGDNHDERKEPQSGGPNQAKTKSNFNWAAVEEAAVEKRDIKSYEPVHAHKVRHELHRKSQPASPSSSSSLIDSQSEFVKKNSSSSTTSKNTITNNASLVFLEKNKTSFGPRAPQKTDGLFAILKSSTIHNRNHHNYNQKEWKARNSKFEDEKRSRTSHKRHPQEQVHPHHHQTIHNNSNQNQTNKLFPSIAFEETPQSQRKNRSRALFPTSSSSSSSSESQVPAGGGEKEEGFLCHEQPGELNHHNSNRKDLLDQRKTKRKREDNKDFREGKGKHKLRFRTSPDKRKTTTNFHNDEFTSAEDNEIGKTRKKNKEGRESLLAKLVGKKSERIMSTTTTTTTTMPMYSRDFDMAATATARKSLVRRRDVGLEEGHEHGHGDTKTGRVGSSSSSSSFSSPPSQSQPNKVFELRRNRKVEEDNTGKYYFFPVSSSASSTTYLETNSPPIIYPSSPLLQQFGGGGGGGRMDEDGKINGSDATNNGSSSASKGTLEKKLYVYGAGCGVKLVEWVDHVSGIMLILGFCIIGFVKTCFLVILRTEIREMIEKINMIEPEEVALMSPNTGKSGSLVGVTHPLLQNPHRASTVSAQGMLLPTIRSPDGPSSFISDRPGGLGLGLGLGGLNGMGMGGMYNRTSRHYLRRASNFVGGDRSHSNETMNMSLLLGSQHDQGGGGGKGRSNPNLSSAPGSSGTIANLEEKDPVSGLSITVPSSTNSSSYVVSSSQAASVAVRYLRRSSTCSSSTNPTSFPYQFGIDCSEPRAGPSHRLYYFDAACQPHSHHHHHYMRNRSHSRNMSCGAILPLTSTYRTNSAAAAASAALAFNRVVRVNPAAAATLSSATTTTSATSNLPGSTGCSFSSNSKDETEMIVSVSLEHIPSSDQDEEQADEKTTAPEIEEDEKDKIKKDWAAATQFLDCVKGSSTATKRIEEEDESLGTNLDTFYIDEEECPDQSNPHCPGNSSASAAGSGGGGGSGDPELQRRNGNNNVDLTNSLPMSYIGTAV